MLKGSAQSADAPTRDHVELLAAMAWHGIETGTTIPPWLLDALIG